MARIPFALLSFVLLLTLVATAAAQSFNLGGLGGPRPVGNPVTARAALSANPLAPGKEALVAVEVTIDRRYHIQAATAPQPYIATKLAPASPAPDGVAFGQPRYPVAHDVPAPAGLTGPQTLPVYEGKIYLLLPVTLGPSFPAAGDHVLRLSLTAQACDATSCLPSKTVSLEIPFTVADTSGPPTDAALLSAAQAQAYAEPTTTPAAPTAAPAAPAAVPAAAPSQEYAAVRRLSDAEQLALINDRPYAPSNAQDFHYSLGAIVLLALVGGMILNIMPCVLPVIPLKALSLVQQAHGDRRLAVLHGLTFSAGVVTLFVALAVVLRTLGLFYGQQFQSPAFLIAMVFFVIALALSMIGVWTINPPTSVYTADASLASHSGFLGSFANGLMATLLATPCSAPYLGPVLAWALVQPAWLTALALALVGVGMSLPYLVLAAFPQLLSRFPKAGRWSELLKQGLGIVMLGVAVYLITLIPNVQLWPWVMLGAVVVGLVCWAWGQIPTGTMSLGRIWTIRGAAVVAGLAVGVALYFVGANMASLSRPVVAEAGGGRWQPFNVALLDAALADGRPVVVDWTADWCINCHVLEAVVLSKEPVQNAFTQANALLLRADLSVDNPPATALNRKLGSEAIPVLAIFKPGDPHRPTVFRDSYTQQRVINTLK